MTDVSRNTAWRVMLGETLPAESPEKAVEILTLFFSEFGIDDAASFAKRITEDAMRFAEDCKLHAVGFSNVIGMQTIHFVFETEDAPFDFENEYGCFCYVYNLEAPHCSEYGSCGFKRRGEAVYRIW